MLIKILSVDVTHLVQHATDVYLTSHSENGPIQQYDINCKPLHINWNI
jgi:hypothetical protein